ncbi:MAG: hypothetical protein Edafosvirus14_10 [Edafosvirus sp.]|uniref:NifS-like protein n=1 Tax=Edafosvirus sp. TaxID=2487765 RepID=A0A3G4ZY19_9VIRU|nr:MAG: hypothetical protein Edafosvirus14_10 [Edafosvirus sp.]
MGLNFDYAANVKMKSEITDMIATLNKKMYNPNSLHALGLQAKKYFDDALNIISECFSKNYKFIEFVPGGGSCANTRAIIGTLGNKTPKTIKGVKRDIILTSTIEHSSIDKNITKLLNNLEYTVIKTPVTTLGIIDIAQFKDLLESYKDRLVLVSIMNVNNETGKIQPIHELMNICKKIIPDIPFHSDITQGIGTLWATKIFPDIISFGTYKIGGPYYGIVLTNNILEDDYYGTPDTTNIYCSALSLKLYQSEYIQTFEKSNLIKSYIIKQFDSLFDKLKIKYINLSLDDSVPYIITYILPGFQGKMIQKLLSDKNIYIGSGSACSSNNNTTGSHVMKAMGYSNNLSYNSIRISFSPNEINDIALVDVLVNSLEEVLTNLIPLVKNLEFKKPTKQKMVVSNSITKKGMRLNIPLVDVKEDIKYDLIKISVSEAYLKGTNRTQFIKKLFVDIKKRLNKDWNVRQETNVFIIKPKIELDQKNFDDIVDNISKVPGTATVSPCYSIIWSDDKEQIISDIVKYISIIYLKDSYGSFKIDTKIKSGNKFNGYTNSDMNILFGQYIVDNFKGIVNLDDPNIIITVEIRNNIILLYTQKYKGMIGLPLDIDQKMACFVDNTNYLQSLISCHQMTSRGVQIDCYVEQELVKNDTFIEFKKVLLQYNPQIQFITLIDPMNLLLIKNLPYISIIWECSDNDTLDYLHMLKEIGRQTEKMIICSTICYTNIEIQNMANNIGYNIKSAFDKNVSLIQQLLTKEIYTLPIKSVDNSVDYGKVLVLLSGGIDSPVASYLLATHKIPLSFIHFTTDIDKIDNIRKIKNVIYPKIEIEEKEKKIGSIFVVEFKKLQDEIAFSKSVPENYRTILYKIYMVMIANYVAKKYNLVSIATGNSLGQVASQTYENLYITDYYSDLPIISPLLGYSKDKIITIAQKIGTYQPSICNGTNDCCIMYLPKHPILKANLKVIDKCLKLFPDYLNKIKINCL